MTLINDDFIESTADEGVEMEDDAAVTNYGTIKGFDDALQVGENAVIENYGTIENTQAPGNPDPQDAIDIDSGRITNGSTGVIKSVTDAAIDFDEAEGDGLIVNRGRIEGTRAVETDSANARSQIVDNHGQIIGTSGLALNLGAGADALNMYRGGTVDGGADFGVGIDSLWFASDFFEDAVGLFGGGAIFDGAGSFDTVEFAGVMESDITGVSFSGDVLSLGLFGTAELRLTAWERYVFEDVTLRFDGAAGFAPVPLPAPLLMLLGALGGLALVRRRAA